MALAEKEVRETTVQTGNTVETTQQVHDPAAADEHRSDVVERVIWFIAGVLLTLLAIRFVLALLGANPENGFANFIYTLSTPFVSPFFSLFGYDFTAGASRFELFTLVAMAVYALIAYGIAKLATITRQ